MGERLEGDEFPRRSGSYPGAVEHSLSHNIFVPGESVDIGPMAKLRTRGHLHNSAKSAVRALEAVELLAKVGKPLRAFEISHVLGLSPSSADQLLKTLVDSAYLLFDPATKHYEISPRIAMLTSSLSSLYFGGNALQEVMDSLHADLGRGVNLLASQGSFMQVLDFRDPPETASQPSPATPPPVHLAFGIRVPLFGSCSGAAWLAKQGDDKIREAITRCRRELGPLARDERTIFQGIEDIRRKGYALGGFSGGARLLGVALALPTARNGQILVVSIGGPLEDLAAHELEIVSAMRQTITRTLAKY